MDIDRLIRTALHGRGSLLRAALLGAALTLVLDACTEVDRSSSAPEEDVASVQIAIREAPEDAECAHIHVVGPKGVARTREENLKPGQPTVFTFEGLPPGPTVFSAQAFDAPCADVDPDEPSYVSNQVHRRLRVGTNGEVVLTMRPVGVADVDVVLDFPGDDRGRWVSLDGSPAGTLARAQFDAEQSTPASSFFDVFVSGYFVRERMGDDGRAYSELTFPGLQRIGQVGAPDLPAVRLDLAVMTSAMGVELGSVEVMSSMSEQLLVWPAPEAQLDHPEGKPEKFARDEKIYGGGSPFPASDGEALQEVRPKMGSIDGASVHIYPVHWDPAKQVLEVASHARYRFDHDGDEDARQEITRDRALAADATFANWSAVSSLAPANLMLYTGDFLFVYPEGYHEELAPLITQKKARGFAVTELTTAETGTTCASIRAAIEGWYDSKPAWRDKYALLVGDTDVIPQCTAPSGDPTDDLYASTNGDDLDEEIYLGRLSVDSETDAATQVAKILAYSDAPSLFFDYGSVLLVAHKEDAPGKYVGAHESVRTASYATPPAFSTLYGHVPGSNDAAVSAEINSGMGLVSYRGHGSTGAWTGWDLSSEYYDAGDLAALVNASNVSPLVWSFACSNSHLDDPDSVAELWMESSSRAVAHYGATVPSYTHPNHELDRAMFQAVYDTGLTIHAQAIEAAEDQMVAYDPTYGWDNAWMYLLLGDPELRIRRGAVLVLVLELPVQIEVCRVGPCPLDVRVLDELGNPVPDVLVSVFKEGMDGKDEVLDNRYAGRTGVATLDITPSTPGELLVSVRDQLGNSSTEVVEVR